MRALPRQVEILVDVLQPRGRNRFHPDQRSLNPRRLHSVKKIGVFSRLHGDLGKENRVVRELRQSRHQLKPFCANGSQLVQPGGIFLLRGQVQIGERDRIEVIIRQGNEAEPEAAQLNNFLEHYVRGALARFLSISPPN